MDCFVQSVGYDGICSNARSKLADTTKIKNRGFYRHHSQRKVFALGVFWATIPDSNTASLFNFFDHCFTSHAYGPDEVAPDGTASLIVGNRVPSIIFKPGSLTIQAEVQNNEVIEKVGSPYTVAIEEPIKKQCSAIYSQQWEDDFFR